MSAVTPSSNIHPPEQPIPTTEVKAAPPTQNTTSTLISAAPIEGPSCISQFFTTIWNLLLSLFCLTKQELPVQVSVKGRIGFDAAATALLETLFTESNLKLLKALKPQLYAQDKEHKVSHVYGTSPGFEIADFPNLVFKLPSDHALADFELAQSVCENPEDLLNCLIIPDFSKIEVRQGDKKFIVVAQKKYPRPKREESQLMYEKHEEEIYDHVIQFTKLICKAHLWNINWESAFLLEEKEEVKIILPDLITEIDHLSPREGLLGVNPIFGGYQDMIGLVAMLPKHAEWVFSTAKTALSPHYYQSIAADLATAVHWAKIITQHHSEAEEFHQAHGITHESPAISEEDIERLEATLDSTNAETFRRICETINAVIAEQSEVHINLVHAREWRLTMDDYTADSNWESIIADNFSFIKQALLPIFEEQGIVHSYTGYQQALDFKVHLRRPLGQYDLIVYF